MAKVKGKEIKHKVVVNGDYGGFHLSDEAVRWLEQNATDQDLLDFLAKERVECNEKDRLWSSVEDLMQYDLLYNYKEKGIPRHHKDLVAVVEALGKNASGMCSHLVVSGIYGDIYRIDEYDGWETAVEPDDIDWVTIGRDED